VRALRCGVGDVDRPPEEALISGACCVDVGSDESVDAQAADALGPDPCARLPDREDRALRVLQNSHAADVPHVEGIVDDPAAELLHAVGGESASSTLT